MFSNQSTFLVYDNGINFPLCKYRVLVNVKFERSAYLSIALDSLTAWANMSLLILCSISSSWTLVHLWRAARDKCDQGSIRV